MDVRRHIYAVLAELHISKLQGNAFEDFFADVAQRAFGTDFVKIRAAGKSGDKKCDGYKKSTDTLFACYAPRGTTPKKLQAKISSDLSGAMVHWPDMREWCFVHNDGDGLDVDTFKLMEEMASKNETLKVVEMGPLDLKKLILSLDNDDLADLFGPAPSTANFSRYGFPEIARVVEKVSQSAELGDAAVQAPSPEKLAKNDLSEDIAALLQSGEVKAPLFRRFFADTARVLEGERIAAWFRTRFAELEADTKDSSEIFYTLVDDAGGLAYRPQPEQAAVLGLMSYLFHSCDIFRDP